MAFFYTERIRIMPDWTAPFTTPKATTDEFRKMKAEYIAKHGYTITVPGLSDVIHIGMPKNMTEGETELWRKREYDQIPEPRLSEIREMKKKKKEKFLAMLGSPTPHIVNNAGSLMTSIDNAQDALGTLGFIGQIALAAAPRIMGTIGLGVVGWVMGAAEILNLVQHLGYKSLGSKKAKREKDKATKDNPKSKLLKMKEAMKTKSIWPSQGRIVEALQVSDNIFGVGICLGPLVGFAIESVTGPMRRISGAKVNVNIDWPILSDFTMKAQRESRAQLAYIGAGLQTEPDEVLGMAMAHYLSVQEIYSHTSELSSFDNIKDIENVEIAAPIPSDILTLEVIEEEGVKVEDCVGWPHSGKKWLRIGDIANEYAGPCKDFQADFMRLHNNDWIGYAYGGMTTQTTEYTFANVEGENNVEYDYTAESKWGHIMLDNGLVLKKDQPEYKFRLVEDEINRLSEEDEKPTLRDFEDFCDRNNIILESFLET